MALVLDPTEQRKNRQGKSKLTYLTEDVFLYGKIGTLEHFGFQVEDDADDLGTLGISRIVTRKAHRRSRWLGDTVKSTVRENQAIQMYYPSRRGTALPGSPIVLQNLTTGDKWTLNLQGDIGVFVAALTAKTNPFDIQLWGFTGNRYLAPILKAGSAPAGMGAITGSGPAPAPANP